MNEEDTYEGFPVHPTKSEALKWLQDNPLSCGLWRDKGKMMSAIYWNGERRIQPADQPITKTQR